MYSTEGALSKHIYEILTVRNVVGEAIGILVDFKRSYFKTLKEVPHRGIKYISSRIKYKHYKHIVQHMILSVK